MGRQRKRSLRKKMNPTFYVFCEGETEQEYVNYLRSVFRVPIEIKSKIAGTRINERYIKSYLRGRPFLNKDKIFLMYDLDISGVLKKLKQIKNAEIIVSNPCIEIWFLFHIQDQNRSLSTKSCVDLVVKQWSDYQKGILGSQIRRDLLENYKKAINFAKQKVEYSNPSSTLHKLLEMIESVKEEK